MVMEHFVGLDVSVRETSLCVVDHVGKIVKEARVPTEPGAIVALLGKGNFGPKRVGLEAGPTSQWLYAGLAEAGLPVICVEAQHMRSALSAQRNKMVCPGRGRVRRERERALRQDRRVQLEREVAPCTFAVWMCRCGRRPSASSTPMARL
jgi:transposase